MHKNHHRLTLTFWIYDIPLALQNEGIYFVRGGNDCQTAPFILVLQCPHPFFDASIQMPINTLLVIKISSTFQDPRSIFQDPAVRQRCLNIKTNSSYYGVRGRAPAVVIFFTYTDKI